MKFRPLQFLSVLISPWFLTGCGLVTPDIAEPWDRDIPPGTLAEDQTHKWPATAQIEFEIRKRIYCDLKEAVQDANTVAVSVGDKYRQLLPNDWGAQLSISLAVDEFSELNPGVALKTPIHNGIVNFVGQYLGPSSIAGAGLLTGAPAAQTYGPLSLGQSYSLGLGGKFASTASRTDTFNPYWSIEYLMKPITEKSDCRTDPFLEKGVIPASSSPLLIQSDLGIKDWLVGAMMVNSTYHSYDVPQSFSGGDSKSSPQKPAKGARKPNFSRGQTDTVTLQLKFVIVSNGNINPTWTLMRVSANTGSPLFSTGRTRTHDVIITIGPNNETSAWAFNSAQIGRAVGASRIVVPVQ